MCWMCDNPGRTTEDYLDTVRAKITAHRWAIQYIEDEKSPFAYTIGLHALGAPELLMMGLPPRTSARLLNSIACGVVDDGTTLRPAMHIDYQSEYLLEVVEVEHPDVHLKFASGIFGTGIRALQLVWTDDSRQWPWDRGWTRGHRPQPVLGVRTPLAG